MRRLAMLSLILLAACDGPPPPADAGTRDAATPIARIEPAPPQLTPCPEGWEELEVAGVPVCGPTPGGAIECGAGEARFPGTAGCAPVGRACPAGEYAADLPDSGVLYVRPGGAGHGSLAAPFGSIADALAASTAGATIALAKGTYDEAIAMRSGVTVRGACAAETILQRSTARGASISAAAGVTDAVVADVGVRRSDNIGALVEGELRLSGVVIEEAQLFGLAVLGGQLEAEGLVVRGTRAFEGGDGAGAVVRDGSLVINRAVFEENQQFGIGVSTGGRAELTDVASRAQVPDINGLGAGLVAESGGVIVGTRVELSDARGASAIASSGGVLELTDAVVRGARAEGRDQGFGLAALGGVVRATRVWLPDDQGTATAALSGGELDFCDIVVSDTVAPPEQPGWAVGVQIADGSIGALERVLVTDGMAAGVAAMGAETSLRALDLMVRDIDDEGTSGVGVYVDAADAEIARVSIERATEAGFVITGGHLDLSHARVTDTRPDPIDGRWGRGLEALGADVEIEHARFEGQREVALIFSGGRSHLRAIEVVDTRERGCAESSCADAPGGIGLGVYGGAEVTVEGFAIRGVPLCGVQLASDGELDLSDGEIADAAIGACVQVDGYDVARLTDRVAFIDTGTRIQTTSHYVPEVHDPLAQ